MAVTDVLMVMLLLAAGYVLLKSGKLEEIMGGNFQLPALPGLPAPAPSGGGGGPPPSGGGPRSRGGGGGGAPAPAGGPGGATTSTGSGDCAKTIYQATGQKVDNGKQTKKGTRHYASGKPDDVTEEWGTKVSFKNYEFTCYVTIGKVDHDDTVSMKFGGTHMGSGWYDCGIGFNSGQGCLGKEEKHPSTDLCVVKGKSIGSIVGKKIGMKCVHFANSGGGGQVELWADKAANGNWEILCPRTNNIGGFAPNGAQETVIRIDAAPQITMHCSSINEVTPSAAPSGGGAAPPAAGGGTPAPAPAEAAEPAKGAEEDAKKPAEDEKKSEYGRVNRSYSSRRVRYF